MNKEEVDRKLVEIIIGIVLILFGIIRFGNFEYILWILKLPQGSKIPLGYIYEHVFFGLLFIGLGILFIMGNSSKLKDTNNKIIGFAFFVLMLLSSVNHIYNNWEKPREEWEIFGIILDLVSIFVSFLLIYILLVRPKSKMKPS